jgi:hypothetical protein
MPERITSLHVNRVAFVPAGDNPEAEIVLWKGKPGSMTYSSSANAVASKDAAPKRDPRLTRGRVDRLRQAWESLGAVIGEASREEDTVTDTAAKQYELPSDAPEELRAYVEGLQAEAATAKAELEKVQEQEEAPDADAEIAKALAEVPEAVRELIAKAKDDAEAAQAEAAAATEQIAKMQEASETAEAIAKASEWRFLRLDAAAMGKMLRALRKADPDLAEQVETALGAANAVASESLVEIGKGGGSDAPTEAEAKLRALADEIAKRDGITQGEAFVKALSTDEGKALHREAEKEASER